MFVEASRSDDRMPYKPPPVMSGKEGEILDKAIRCFSRLQRMAELLYSQGRTRAKDKEGAKHPILSLRRCKCEKITT